MNYRQQQAKWAKRRERVRTMIAQGMTPTEIAKRLRVTRQRASALCKKVRES